MEILNVGPLELIIILVIMFILLGPKDMVLTAARIGRWLRSFTRSPMWREIMTYSKEIRDLPKMLMDETGVEQAVKEIQKRAREATQEINEQLKEVSDAAKIGSIEPLILDTGLDDSTLGQIGKIARPDAEKPASLSSLLGITPSQLQPAVLETTPAVLDNNLDTSQVANTGSQPAKAGSQAFTSGRAAQSPARFQPAPEGGTELPSALAPRRVRVVQTSSSPVLVVSEDSTTDGQTAAPPSNGHGPAHSSTISFAPRRSRSADSQFAPNPSHSAEGASEAAPLTAE